MNEINCYHYTSILIISLILLSNTSDYKLRTLSRNTIFIVLALFSALRFNVGYDYPNYVERIYEIGIFNNSRYYREPLSFILLKLSSVFGNNNIFFVTNSIITIYLVHTTISRFSNDYNKSIWVFYTFPMFYLNSFSIVRNFTAIAICFYSFNYIVDRNFKLFLLTVSIGSLFHNSVILFLPAYFLYNEVISYSEMLGSFTIVYILKPIVQRIAVVLLPSSLAKYFIMEREMFAGTKTIIVLVIIFVLSLLFRDELVKKNKLNKFYINVMFISVAVYVIFLKYGHVPFRVTLPYYIFMILLVPELFDVILVSAKKIIGEENGLDVAISYFLISSYYVSFYLMFLYMLTHSGKAYVPYEIFLNK